MYLDRSHLLMQSFKGNLHHPQYLKKNMVEKISGSGLAFEDLKTVYSKSGKEGLIAILSKPPSSSASPSPRVTTTTRILAAAVKYFEENIQQRVNLRTARVFPGFCDVSAAKIRKINSAFLRVSFGKFF